MSYILLIFLAHRYKFYFHHFLTKNDIYKWISETYSNKSLRPSEKINKYNEIEIIGLNSFDGNLFSYLYYVAAVSFLEEEKLIEAIKYLDKAYDEYESKNEYVNLTSILLRLGMAYGKCGNYTRSLESLQKCYDIATEDDDLFMASNVVNNIGSIHYSIKNYQKAIENYLEAIRIKKEIGDDANMALSILNVAKCYLEFNKLEEAKRYASMCLGFLLKHPNENDLGQTMIVLGMINFNLKDYEKADEYFKKSLTIFTEINRKEWIIISYENLGLNEIRRKNTLKGIEYLDLAKSFVDENLSFFHENLNETYSEAYEEMGEYKKALDHYKEFHKLHTEHLNEDSLRSVNELEISYKVEGEKQKAQIEKLKNVELVRLNEEKNEFLGLVAHDLKNPLSAIILSLSSIKRNVDKFSSADIVTRLDKAEKITIRMQEIIKNLLDVNAIERGDFNFNINKIDVVKIIEQTYEEMKELFKNKNIEFVLSASKDQVFINADALALHEILSNLISNGVKYSYPNSKVIAEINQSDSSTKIKISDMGMGIKEEEIGKVFKKFAKTSNKPTAGESSTGLGLSIVKKLTELMKGKISVYSEFGKGTSFTLEF